MSNTDGRSVVCVRILVCVYNSRIHTTDMDPALIGNYIARCVTLTSAPRTTSPLYGSHHGTHRLTRHKHLCAKSQTYDETLIY